MVPILTYVFNDKIKIVTINIKKRNSRNCSINMPQFLRFISSTNSQV